jgi:hypothetical protein
MIGIPIVTGYGSSFGTYEGSRLKDYKSPDPNTNNIQRTEQDLIENKNSDQVIKDFIFARLGHPTVRVELTDYQIKTCIDEAVAKLSYHAPEWMTQYAVFDTSANINVYELPFEVASNLTDVIFRRQMFGLHLLEGSLEYDFAIMFFSNHNFFNNMNMGQYVLMQQYMKQIRKVLGQNGTWKVIDNKYLHLFPVPGNQESVILEFRAINYATILPAYKNWLQRYSLCVAKEILGRVRSKYKTLPGPGGGSQLDGAELLQEAAREKEQLLEELASEIGSPPLFDIM